MEKWKNYKEISKFFQNRKETGFRVFLACNEIIPSTLWPTEKKNENLFFIGFMNNI